jgi:hypothetical protein
MSYDLRVDDYITSLPDWQQAICTEVRHFIHEAEPNIEETIKFTNRPYFTLEGNVCAFLATKDHINIFIYDPIAPDPTNLINQGNKNVTARAIQIFKGGQIEKRPFLDLIKAISNNNRAGGWRKISINHSA